MLCCRLYVLYRSCITFSYKLIGVFPPPIYSVGSVQPIRRSDQRRGADHFQPYQQVCSKTVSRRLLLIYGILFPSALIVTRRVSASASYDVSFWLAGYMSLSFIAALAFTSALNGCISNVGRLQSRDPSFYFHDRYCCHSVWRRQLLLGSQAVSRYLLLFGSDCSALNQLILAVPRSTGTTTAFLPYAFHL